MYVIFLWLVSHSTLREKFELLELLSITSNKEVLWFEPVLVSFQSGPDPGLCPCHKAHPGSGPRSQDQAGQWIIRVFFWWSPEVKDMDKDLCLSEINYGVVSFSPIPSKGKRIWASWMHATSSHYNLQFSTLLFCTQGKDYFYFEIKILYLGGV
jgi:hypothetical protein